MKKPLNYIPPLALAVFIFTRLIAIFGYDAYMSDVELYFYVAQVGIQKDLHAYTDVLFGYPPLSLLTVYLPYFFSQDYKLYRILYQLTNIAFDYFCFLYLAKFLHLKLALNKKCLAQALLLYSTLGLFHAHYMYDRVDMFIVLCFMAAIYYAAENKFIYAIISGVLGTLWKIIPIFWLPIVVLFYGRTSKRKLLTGTLLSLLPSLLFLWIYNSWRSGDLFKTLLLHSDRGIQIESLFATPFMMLKTFFDSTPVFIELIHGAHHLAGDGVSPPILFLAKYFGFGVLLVFYVSVSLILFKYLKNWSQYSAKDGAVLIFFSMSSVVLLFLVFQRVFSTTFMIWLIPIFSIFWALYPRRIILYLTLSLSALTYIGFDLGYLEFRNFNKFYNIIYCLRNFLLVIYAFIFFKEFYLHFLNLKKRG